MDHRQLMQPIPRATWKEKWGSSIGIYKRFKVSGNSMLPLLRQGDFIFSQKSHSLKLGDIVVTKHPFKKEMVLIKRIEKISAEGYYLLGLNLAESTDSRNLGLFKKEAIFGKVVSMA